MIKRILIILISASLLLAGAAPCFAVEIDGIINNLEWYEGKVFSFEHPDGFNNDVTFAVIRLLPDYDSYQLNMCIAMTVSDYTDYRNTAVILSFDGENQIQLRGDGTSDYEKSLYSADYAVHGEKAPSQIFYEIKTGLKHGFDVENLEISLCDCNGEPSNVFGFDLTSLSSPAETTATTTQIQTTTTEKSKTTKTTKTTKDKTKSSKSKSGSDDDFPFQKVEISDETAADVSADVSDETSESETVNLTDRPVSNSEVKKKLFAGVAVVCAGLILTCAVYNGIKKSGKS